MNEKDLKAFIATFYLNGVEDPQSVAFIAVTLKEAQDTFIKWARGRGLYDRMASIVVQRLHKTKNNKHLFTIEFYERQNAFVNKIFNEINKQ